jgi:hypothetical protein
MRESVERSSGVGEVVRKPAIPHMRSGPLVGLFQSSTATIAPRRTPAGG